MNEITNGILLLIVVLVLHLVEEVKTGFRTKLPLGAMPLWVFVVINVLLYSFCAVTLYLSFRDHPAAVPMAWIFAVGMMLNGLGHLGVMIVRRAYFPGGLTSPALVLASVYLMFELANS